MRALIVALIALYSTAAICEIYKWTDGSGRVHFSDKKPAQANAEQVRVQINSYTNVTYQLVPAQSAISTNKNVVIYSTEWCGYCKKAKAYFAAHDITYIDYDIEHSTEAKENYDAIGGRGVPIIFVGQSRMNGFSAEGFDYLYRQK